MYNKSTLHMSVIQYCDESIFKNQLIYYSQSFVSILTHRLLNTHITN